MALDRKEIEQLKMDIEKKKTRERFTLPDREEKTDGSKSISALDIGKEAVHAPFESLRDLEDDQSSRMIETERNYELARKQRDQQRQDLLSDTRQLFEKGKDRTNLEQESGVTQLRDDLSSLSAEIRAQRSIGQARILDIGRRHRGSKLTRGDIDLRQTQQKSDNAIEALLLDAQASVIRGDLEVSERAVNSAIQAKYEPIEQELQLKEMQLGYLEENYKEGKLDLNKRQQELLQTRKENISQRIQQKKNIRNLLEKNAGSIPADIARDVLNAESEDEVMSKIFPYLGAAEKLEHNIKQLEYNNKLQAQRQAEADAQSGKLTTEQYELATKYRKELTTNNTYKKGMGFQREVANVISVLSGDVSGLSSVTAVNAFQRLVDPGVAVREGDVDLIRSAESLDNKLKVHINALQTGTKLSKENAAEMKDIAIQLYSVQRQMVEDAISPVKASAEEQGINFDKYVSAQDFLTVEEMQARADGFVGSSGKLVVEKLSDDQQSQLAEWASQLGRPIGDLINDKDVIDNLLGFEGAEEFIIKDESVSGLSSQFESNNDPGAVGYDKVGGKSYGKYQMTKETAKNFAMNSEFAHEFSTFDVDSKAFEEDWKRVARKNPNKFAIEQEKSIQSTHYKPALLKAETLLGISEEEMPLALRQVIFSTAVQHGANNNILESALPKVRTQSIMNWNHINNRWEDQEEIFSYDSIIDEIYKERETRFGSSTEAVRNSVLSRFEKEKRLAFNNLI